jgi:hypothetical protein
MAIVRTCSVQLLLHTCMLSCLQQHHHACLLLPPCRWQAAINSGGKYLYLGSYVAEDDAAKAFDRAAIKLRNKKAKLNFTYEEYVDKGESCSGAGRGGGGGLVLH